MPTPFDHGDPLDVFAEMTVYLQFNASASSYRPVETIVPGHPGRWLCAYSSFEYLNRANRGEEVEYSTIRGKQVLVYLSTGLGLWLDRGYPESRKILLPAIDATDDDKPGP